MKLLFTLLIIFILLFILLMTKKVEGFRGLGRGFRGSGRGFRGSRRGFNRDYGWYYPNWYYYNDNIRSCINNYIDECGTTKQCYDQAINICT
jgi:hypothetical protein